MQEVRKMKKKLSPEVQKFLEACHGNPELALFYTKWLSNNLDATKAYKELHPDVTHDSARTLGSRLLHKVDKSLLMQAYGLDTQTYFDQMKQGLEATRPIGASILVTKEGKVVKSEHVGAIEVADHYARKPYHDKLGRLLGLEGRFEFNQNIQQNNFFNLKDEQITEVTDQTGSVELGEEVLIETLVEGALPREDETDSVGVHSQEL